MRITIQQLRRHWSFCSNFRTYSNLLFAMSHGPENAAHPRLHRIISPETFTAKCPPSWELSSQPQQQGLAPEQLPIWPTRSKKLMKLKLRRKSRLISTDLPFTLLKHEGMLPLMLMSVYSVCNYFGILGPTVLMSTETAATVKMVV